tara:strand:+ start:125 stop:286 length:162 start_codon:yes stop_codon:yes gene_type:complete
VAKGVVLLQFDGFGKGIELVRQKKAMAVFYPGGDGKKRLADDLIMPVELAESG